MTALRRSPRVLRDEARNGCSWVTGNSEKSVQEPAEIPGRGIDGVTTAEEPEPTAVLVLDLPIVAGSAALAIGRPPLSGDAFGSVRAPDPVPLAAPNELRRRMVRQHRQGLDRLRRFQQPSWTRQGRGPGSLGRRAQRADVAHAALR